MPNEMPAEIPARVPAFVPVSEEAVSEAIDSRMRRTVWCARVWARATMRSAAPLTAAIAVLVLPHVSKACSVCSAGRDEENQFAFLISTLFMSLLPLITIGGIVYFLWRRLQKVEAEQEARRVAIQGAPSRSSVAPEA